MDRIVVSCRVVPCPMKIKHKRDHCELADTTSTTGGKKKGGLQSQITGQQCKCSVFFCWKRNVNARVGAEENEIFFFPPERDDI